MTAGPTAPSDDFVGQIKEALEHLYDFSYLQTHPLLGSGSADAERPGESRIQRLRQRVLAAIESLAPGQVTSFRAPQARLYNLLLLHYVEGLTVQEAARELNLSRRQAHRDLRRGEESIAALLWDDYGAATSPEEEGARMLFLRQEMARTASHTSPTDLGTLLAGAVAAVQPLAQQRGIEIAATTPQEPVIISADPMVARQVLVNTLSGAIGLAKAGRLTVTLRKDPPGESVTFLYLRGSTDQSADAIGPTIAALATGLGWTLSQEDLGEGARCVVIRTGAQQPTLLVIDDNEGFAHLVEDYLTGHSWTVVAASDAQEGLRLARELAPMVILLDVMMPSVDGWELLQRLHHDGATASIPVVVCSVINNPDLARSLGAALLVPKPLSRDAMLAALQQVLLPQGLDRHQG